MNPIAITVLGISFIFLATTIGSAFVFIFKGKPISGKINQIFLGFASGVMLSASIFSLLMPAIDFEAPLPSFVIVGIGVVLGALFIWGIDLLLPHIHSNGEEEGLPSSRINKTTKMFFAVTIHNIPEGLSVGIAYGIALASWTANAEAASIGALMLALGIGIQNIPEGAIVSLNYRGQGETAAKSFWLGTASGAVEPLAAVIGLFLAMQIQAIMPWALSFAAGCMIYVIAEDMIPDMKGEGNSHHGVWSFIVGFVLMMVLDVALG